MAIPKPILGPQGVTLENAGDKFLEHAILLSTDEEEMKKREGSTMGNPISLAPPVLSEADWAEKQIERTVNAGDTWLKNTLKPRKDPKAAAIAANPKRIANLAEAEKKGKWLKSMEAYDLDARQKTIEAIGAEGFVKGVEARKAKIENKIKVLRPLVIANKETIAGMPNKTPVDRENRMIANLRNMRKIGDAIRGI